ncbi:hypothetical protein DFH09DRAFT_356000 [Mycena vulgaris]|nr:hypothetical protein DFH09DRAFT_356000 [Mycena vulgaris]
MQPAFSSFAKAQSVDPDRIPRIALANLYPKQVWYLLATFLALVAACHFLSAIYAHFTRQHVPTRTDISLRHGVSWRRLPLAILELFRTITFRWSITIAGAYTLNVADFILAASYLTIIFTWTFINSKNHTGKKYDPKYWANRCAHIAGSQLPLMTAFGMKNNIISFLTGVSFDKLEHLHRVTARVICVMFWVHAYGRAILDLADDPSESWFHLGVMGASALTLLCLLSIRPLRTRNHEVFMYIHLALGLLALVGAYIHSAEFGYGHYIWPALFLWGLDRTLRLTRILLVNSQLFNKKQPQVTSDATVSILSPHFLRISVDAPPYFRWSAGQSVYITMCKAYARSVTEAHPFTIANAPRDEWTKSDEGVSSSEEHSKEGTVISSKEKESSEGLGSEDRRQLIFILRVRAGFTKRLLDSVLDTPDSDSVTKTFKAFVDGPYSSPPSVRGFDTVVFICGGSGVSFTLPLLLDVLQAARANANPRCKRVVFVWAIRDPDQIEWIADAVTHALLGIPSGDNPHAIDVDIRLHVTAAPEYTQSFDGEERSSIAPDPELAGSTVATDSDPAIARVDNPESPTKQRLFSLPGVVLLQGRPDIQKIINTEIDGARGAVSINGTHPAR